MEQLRPLLHSEEHWDQAIALLVSLDDPELWKAVLDGMDERHLDRRVVGLLARMPDDAPGVQQKRNRYRSVRLNSNSLLNAELTPNIERISWVRTQFGADTGCPDWFDELRKLRRLQRLELDNAVIEDRPVLENLSRLEHLRLRQCTVHALPELPAVRQLSLREVRGVRSVGTYPHLEWFELTRGWGIGEDELRAFMSKRLEQVVLEQVSIATVNFLEDAVARDAPLRTVVLGAMRLVSIDGVCNARHLRYLSVSNAKLDEIDAVATLPTLERLTLVRTRVRSLEPLRKLRELREVDLSGCEWIVSLEPLCRLPKLDKLTLSGTPFTPDNVPAALRECAVWPESFA